jgi:hypothetical protein
MRWILVALLAGCGASDGTDTEKAPLPPMEAAGQPTQGKAAEAKESDCPLALPGAQVRSEVTADGVALVFTTSGGDGGELRDRVQRMADRHNAAPPPAEEPNAAAVNPPPARAAVEEISGGARVVFTPTDPAKVGVLREHIRVHGKEMAEASCGEEAAPARVSPPPPSSPAGESKTAPGPAPTPTPPADEPHKPDRPVTPDQPVSPPTPPPPPPTGVPFVQ